MQDRSKTNVFVIKFEEEEKRKKRSFVLFWNKAKKNEYNRSSTIEDLPLLVPLFKKLFDIIFFMFLVFFGCARDNLRDQKSLGPLKMSLEMAHKVILPPTKIISRSFLNSGTLIVITNFCALSQCIFATTQTLKKFETKL